MEPAIKQANSLDSDGSDRSWLAGQLALETSKAYASDVKQFFDFLHGMDMHDMRKQDIAQYHTWIAQRCTSATLYRKLSTIKRLLTDALRCEIIKDNLICGIQISEIHSAHSSTESPGMDEIRKLLDMTSEGSLIDSRDRAMLYVFCTMGLRSREAANLTVDSLIQDGTRNALDVLGRRSIHRMVEIPSITHQILNEWIIEANLSGNMPLFQEIKNKGGYYLTGKALTTNGIYWIVNRRFKEAGLEGFSPHSLRHFLIAFLIERGADIQSIQRTVGHAHSTTTERYDNRKAEICSSVKELIDF